MKLFKALLSASLVASCLAPTFLLSAKIEIPTDFSQKNKPATIKVLVAKQKEKIRLEAKGRHYIYNPFNNILLSEESSTVRQWVSVAHNGLKWGDLYPGIFQIRIVPADTQGTVLVDGIEYRGCIEIYDLKGKLFVVNEIDIERYLKSIMPTQWATDLDEEVMDAIAIAARTNAYYTASHKPESFWHIDALDVGYQGYAASLQNLLVERAINNTRHMVMLYKGALFPATWTQDCAGKTADFATIFRKEVHAPKGVDAPFAAHDREKHAWTFSISKKDLAKALGAVKLSEFDLYQDEKSQKVYGARLKEDENYLQFDFSKLQKALGAVRLKSNDFNIEPHGDQLVFKGFGEGAGVGLCIFSASAMTDKGDKAPKILASFFPETELANVPAFSEKGLVIKTSH